MLCHFFFFSLHTPNHVTQRDWDFVNGAERWMGAGEARATPPAHKQPIRWRSAAGSAINNNGQEIYGSSLAAGTGSRGLWRSSALSRLPWIPVPFWPLRRVLKTVAVLSRGLQVGWAPALLSPVLGAPSQSPAELPDSSFAAPRTQPSPRLSSSSLRRGTRAVL